MNKNKILIAILIFVLGSGVGYFAKPTKVETKTVEVIKEDIKKQEQKEKIVYKERIVYKDGTVREIEKTEDKSNTSESSSKQIEKTSEKLVKNDIGLNLNLLAFINKNSVQYTSDNLVLHGSMRVIGNITVGAFTDPKFDKKGISVGMSF